MEIVAIRQLDTLTERLAKNFFSEMAMINFIKLILYESNKLPTYTSFETFSFLFEILEFKNIAH